MRNRKQGITNFPYGRHPILQLSIQDTKPVASTYISFRPAKAGQNWKVNNWNSSILILNSITGTKIFFFICTLLNFWSPNSKRNFIVPEKVIHRRSIKQDPQETHWLGDGADTETHDRQDHQRSTLTSLHWHPTTKQNNTFACSFKKWLV